ncbi:ABC-2 family transporter protein [Calditerricola yamamurae]
MTDVWRLLSLFWVYLAQYLKARMAYRYDFLVQGLTDVVWQLVNLVFILVVFTHVPTLGGWSRDEILFIYGYFLVPYGIFACLFNLWDFQERYILRGEIDRVLTRPIHSLAQVCLENLDPEALFGVVTGLIIMGYAGYRLGLDLTWYDPLVFLLLVVGSVLVYAGIYVAIAAIGFFADAKTGIAPMVWNLQNYGRYPVDIYNRLIRIVLTWILPFAYVGLYPSSYFLGRKTYYVYAAATPVVGAVVFALGLWAWNAGVRRYRGVGS